MPDEPFGQSEIELPSNAPTCKHYWVIGICQYHDGTWCAQCSRCSGHSIVDVNYPRLAEALSTYGTVLSRAADTMHVRQS